LDTTFHVVDVVSGAHGDQKAIARVSLRTRARRTPAPKQFYFLLVTRACFDLRSDPRARRKPV
jgi:hypothetical protein